MEVSRKKVIVLCGGSNGNHALVADLGRREDYTVRLITRRPEKWKGTVYAREQKFLTDSYPMYPSPTWWITYSGAADEVYGWEDAAKALDGAHMALMVCPVSAHEDMLRMLFASLPDHPIIIGTSYGQGGFDWLARKLLKGNSRASLVTLFAMKHYPLLCKAWDYGKKINMFGRYPDLRCAVSPHTTRNCDAVKFFLDDIFQKDVKIVTDFIVPTLGATNQILHPSICATLFKGFREGEMVYDRHKLFYMEIDDEAAGYMFDLFITEIPTIVWALDAALKRNGSLRYQVTYEWISSLVGRLPTFAQPKAVLSRALGWGLRSNQRLTKVKAPMIPGKTKDGKLGMVPNIRSRFWLDDIPHGLCVLFGIAELLGLEVPTILHLIRRNQEMIEKEYVTELPDAKGSLLCGRDAHETSAPQAYGIYTLDEFVEWMQWDRTSEPPAIARLSPSTVPPPDSVETKSKL
ncbi:hypothetical protein PTSG_07186 [Salpingoeca rosetta]|uniref:Opine dehydrogenase domain-containing protein n=1 Tax=Salpingoeca rosetta (strain ATCC 50818 / BSB-021) TaxID=946362 RepID=F2UEB0_SALR5|nr:uncharacterized protein PTSG_07186 [Salpingoeca rosetta]EGD74960.1 hypothetical protein PTSG_07186 [Salpingoeca rosetta]|eukprot:XP_004992605.1 hypothetical protein PTSG_07186 [Salpingoeca rosetta]